MCRKSQSTTSILQVGEACICRLSHVLESLKDLRHLSLASNQLAHLPASIWKQKGLVSLDLSNNLLSDLPRECAELISLQVVLSPHEMWRSQHTSCLPCFLVVIGPLRFSKAMLAMDISPPVGLNILKYKFA